MTSEKNNKYVNILTVTHRLVHIEHRLQLIGHTGVVIKRVINYS